MIALAAAAALALGAPPDPGLPFGGKLPYPAPKLVTVTEKTKCDMGTVLSVEVERGTMHGTTPAGVVTYAVGPAAQVIGKDGKPLGGLATVPAGAKYRAYYVIDGGAKVLEIDLE